MSNTPQQPADGWQPSQQQPPVYRPQEQPPAEEPPPWSPESQRMSPTSQQVPVEDDGTVKYVGGPGAPSSPQYGPPPGVPVSPFDTPAQPQHPGMPASDPFGGGGGMPVSGMPVSGMPPVSSIPASGMPVSSPHGQPPYGQQPPYGGGQFGPQGGQLVPVSGGGAQPWGAPDAIQRKKKSGKGPMWLLLVGIVVIAAALGVGGFVLFNGNDDKPTDERTGTIEQPEVEVLPPADTLFANEASGLSVLSTADWAENTDLPAAFADATGIAAEDGAAFAYFGLLDVAQLGTEDGAGLGDVNAALGAKIAEHLGGEVSGDPATSSYRVDARAAEFGTFPVGDQTVFTAVIDTPDGVVGFAGIAGADQTGAVDAMRSTLSFGP
ncbi:hypothetical protein [Glycomyces sp. NRRL B-16210]|uniref:hypothetical protein n=1 Tax=Glycomyces sp. NRRL B-16210 TaxID=1463821 RepID=UPI00105DFBF6|nr:hypothetical protein [Glycomyces sp. NRRL B-16210]